MLSKIPASSIQSLATPANEELTRLASYLNWPSSAQVRPCALSRHGFTYEGHGERTRCVACGIVVDNWQRGDQPQLVHRIKSPRCPFVVAEHSSVSSSSSRQDNVRSTDESVRSQFEQLRVSEPQRRFHCDSEIPPPPSTFPSTSSSARGTPASATPEGPPSIHPPIIRESPVVDRSRPDFVQLRSESVRLSTFHDWPSSAGRIVDPRDLAATGLFYTGHADRVQCAFCRGCLRSWKPGDRADEEHRRHFADCPLVRGAVTGNVPSDSAKASVDSEVSANPPQPTQRIAGEMLVKSTVDKSGNSDSGSMMEAGGDISNSQSVDTIPASSSSSSAAAAAATKTGAEDAMMEMDEECLAELEENKRLREVRTCKVCMDSEVNTVFLPCGHLVCCDTCSPALRNCAVCRALIRGTVRVFLG